MAQDWAKAGEALGQVVQGEIADATSERLAKVDSRLDFHDAVYTALADVRVAGLENVERMTVQRLAALEAKVAALSVPAPAPQPVPTPTPAPVPPPAASPYPIPMPAATGAPEWHGRDHNGSGSYDLYIPPGGPVRAVLSWSTNAFAYSADDYKLPDVQAWAKRNRVAILGYVNYPAGHEQVATIEAALADLATQSKHPELNTVPWMARGFSAGGYRAWHLIKNAQQKGMAFSWFSGAPQSNEDPAHPENIDPAWASDIFALDANDADLFGLFLMGGADSVRRKNTLKYVEGMNGTHDAQWDYAEMPGVGHDGTAIAEPSKQMDLIFFEEVLNHTVWPTARYVAALNKFKRGEFPLEGETPAPTPVLVPPPVVLPPLPATGGWLSVQGNQFFDERGQVWVGRGVNIHDCRSCDACEGVAPGDMLAELKRRIDEAVAWGCNLLRLVMEDDGRHLAYQDDPAYRQSIRDLVAHIGTKPGVRVLVSLWQWDGLLDGYGVPTDAGVAAWSAIASDLATQAHVLFGVCNEPEQNYSGADDDRRIGMYRKCLAAIRTAEQAAKSPAHVVVLQALGGWSSVWGKLLRETFNDSQIAYECHQYSHADAWQGEVWGPAQGKPVIVGEFGPAGSSYMTLDETKQFMATARTNGVSFLAWTFHMRCPPNLLVDNSQGGCGRGMALVPSAWGQAFKDGIK